MEQQATVGLGTPNATIPKIIDMTIDDVIEGLKLSTFSSEELTRVYIARIEEVNSLLHAVTEINTEAIPIAIKLDEERRQGKVRGPLHGVPVLLKDLFSTNDKMQNTVGSSCFVDAPNPDEATVVQKLRTAGAVILGKTALTEFCNSRSRNAPHGQSATGGQCLGPYYPNQDPGGSSSGSAVATCLGLAMASIGTETFGSITLPSQKSATVGLKPTVGLTSRFGIFMVNEYQDTVGPISRTVKDAAYMLQAIAGRDELDSIPSGLAPEALPDYVAACKHAGLVGMRIAAPAHIITQDKVVVAAYNKALEIMRGLGATVLEDVKFPSWTVDTREEEEASLDLSFNLMLKRNVEKYLKARGNPNGVETLSDLIRYIKETPDEDYARWGATEFEAADRLDINFSFPEFLDSLQKRQYYGGDIERLLNSCDCDILVVPGSGDTPSDMGGNPALVLPLGFYGNDKSIDIYANNMVYRGPKVPFGLMFVGRKFSEEKLLAAAFAYEQATKTRSEVSPCIQPNIELPW